jgi:hypothetical protein
MGRKRSNFLLIAFVLLVIYFVFFNGPTRSSFGALTTTTITLPTSVTSWSIPIKDSNGTSLTPIAVTIPATGSATVSIDSYTVGVLTYKVNGTPTSVNVYTLTKTDTNYIATGFYTANNTTTACIKPSDAAARGYATAPDLATEACKAAGYPLGLVSTTGVIGTCTGGGATYSCKPNIISVSVNVPNFITGTTVSYILYSSAGVASAPVTLPLNAITQISTFNTNGYIGITIVQPGGGTASTAYYGNSYTGAAVTIPAGNNALVAGSIIVIPSATITITNNISPQITV